MERKRVVLKGHAHVFAKRLFDLLEGRHHARAERTLEVRELDDGDFGAPRSFDRGIADGNLEHNLGIGQLERGALGLSWLAAFVLGVLDDRGIQLLGPNAALEQAVGSAELFVDDLLEVLKRLCAGQRATVDEKVRRATSAELIALSLVRLNLGIVLGCVLRQVVVELVHVQADFPSQLLERLGL